MVLIFLDSELGVLICYMFFYNQKWSRLGVEGVQFIFSQDGVGVARSDNLGEPHIGGGAWEPTWKAAAVLF